MSPRYERESYRRLMRVLRMADIVLEVVDARVPLITRCTDIEKKVLSMKKPLGIIVNKADLVPEDFLEKVREIIEKEGFPCSFVSSKVRKGLRAVRSCVRRCVRKLPTYKEKIFIGVIGFPNTGKSSLINALRGKHVASTSPIPGWTRGEQIIRLSPRLYLIDSPGVIQMIIEDPLLAVLRGARIKDPLLSAAALVKKILEVRPDALRELYEIDPPEDPMQAIRDIGKRLGLLQRGGEVNMLLAAQRIIQDWQGGKLVAWWI